MNTLAFVVMLALLVTLATANSYNQRSWGSRGSRVLGSRWNSRQLNNGWNSGWNGGHLSRGLNGGYRRHKRAATYDPYRSSHFDSGLGRFDRWGINSGRRSNLGLRSNLGWRSNSGLSLRGY
ncbi:uncharacterized protein LOC143070898 [Mytilus galloprovincialis]|uniref:uncharacterized protein LOC143070898 n=1 Tax=Mytilus galloprovincialis TaxID=29158 RepID=UPI003F7B8A9F